MKDLLVALLKAPYRILLLFPSIAFLVMAGILVYNDKDPLHYVGFACMGALLFLLVRTHIKDETSATLSSEEWFRRIADKLEDCGSANIYLRKFDHPDNFKPEHKENLLKIMSSIQKKVSGGSQITILAYHPDPKEKSGLDWLKSGATLPDRFENRVILRTTQPTSNSSSIYIFDDRTSFYNKIENRKTVYKEENFSTSIVHELIVRGFTNLVGERN